MSIMTVEKHAPDLSSVASCINPGAGEGRNDDACGSLRVLLNRARGLERISSSNALILTHQQAPLTLCEARGGKRSHIPDSSECMISTRQAQLVRGAMQKPLGLR